MMNSKGTANTGNMTANNVWGITWGMFGVRRFGIHIVYPITQLFSFTLHSFRHVCCFSLVFFRLFLTWVCIVLNFDPFLLIFTPFGWFHLLLPRENSHFLTPSLQTRYDTYKTRRNWFYNSLQLLTTPLFFRNPQKIFLFDVFFLFSTQPPISREICLDNGCFFRVVWSCTKL